MKSPAGTSSIRPYASFSSGAGSAGAKDRNRTATTTITAKTGIQRNLRLSRTFRIGVVGAGGAVGAVGGAVGAVGGIVANCGRGMSTDIVTADTDWVASGIGCVVADVGG